MSNEREQLKQAISHLEAQRNILGDSIVDTAIAALYEKLQTARAEATPRRKQVTILFADVSRFTSIAEFMDAEDLSDLINELWYQLDSVIVDSGGMIDKHMGDAVMALFGTPEVHENDPAQAVRCALRMQAALAEFQVQKPTAIQGHPFAKLDIRIGISTGPVVMTEVGAKLEYTAMGSTVNLAERLQTVAPPGGILISHDTYLQVRGIFQLERRPQLALKGKSGPVPTYLVNVEKPRLLHMSNRGVVGLKTSMVGRDSELGLLEAAFRNVAGDEQGRLITVVAEAGIGKSRLRWEFEHQLDQASTSGRVFSARTDQQMLGLPYSLMRELFASFFSIRDSDAPELVHSQLRQGFSQLIGADGAELAQAIGYLIGLSSPASNKSPAEHDARLIRDNAFQAAASFFAAIAAQQPVALILDDLHWADNGSLDFIEYLSGQISNQAVLIVGFARPSLFERCPSFGTASGGQRLVLSPLSQADSLALASDILRRVPKLPHTLLNFVVRRAEGNPFFIEELIKAIIEDGVIVKGENGWQVIAENLDEQRIPPTLTGVIEARLDSLARLEREVMERASVVGNVFWSGVVVRLVPTEDRAAILAALDNLRGKELIYKHEHSDFAGNEEYSFKHIILRDVTYEGVMRKARRDYHAQVVEWLIEQSGERAAEYAGLIGEHYERAESSLMAGQWYIKAAQQAQSSYMDELALTYYHQALKLIPETPEHQAERVTVYEGLGDIYKNQALFHEAVEVYFSMIQSAIVMGDVDKQTLAWLGMAFAQDELGDHNASLKSVTKAEAIARQSGIATTLGRALHGKGWVLQLLGRLDEAEKLGREALSVSGRVDDQALVVSCHNLLATICTARGDYEQAVFWFEQCLNKVRQLGTKSRLPITLSNLGEAKLSLGQVAAATSLFGEALDVARTISSRRSELMAMINLGRVQLALANYEAAAAELQAAIELAGAEQPPFLVICYVALSEALLRQGRSAEALNAAEVGFTLAQATKGWEFIAPTWIALGLVASQQARALNLDGRLYTAAELFTEAVNIYRTLGIKSEAITALGHWANHEQASGNHDVATQLRLEAEELAFRPNEPVWDGANEQR